MILLKGLARMKRVILVSAVLFVLLISLFFRLPAFYFQHYRGDQIIYIALAMKLDKSGFQGYNLRGVDLFKYEDRDFIKAVPAPEGSKGNMLEKLPSYYDIPLFHKPPLFIYALMFSHKLFAHDKPYLALSADLYSRYPFTGPKSFFKGQFYSVFVPVSFSLLLIAATFFFGRVLFSGKVGVCAAMLLSISPIELMTSQKIWADDILAFFVAAALISYYLGKERRNLPLIFMAGSCAGLAALTKPSGSIVILVVLVYELLEKRVFSKQFMVFLVTAVLVPLPWYLQVLKTYGSFFYSPASIQERLSGPDPWFKFVIDRPWYMYLVNTPFQTPLFILVYPVIFGLFGKCVDEKAKAERKKKIFLFVWITMFLMSFLMSKVGKELRYILPAYPAIAILSAGLLETVQKKLDSRFGYHIGSLTAIVAIILCTWWSVSIGWHYLLVRKVGLINLPL
ncbi:MAG: hypothetical protein A2Z72_04175 [Omnitrophica bacterium RBG_13_46_9]|nr:MAG: hypothetical protein A2Z72_04175 [Omnitrophica bacterium RBG_13_46_9]